MSNIVEIKQELSKLEPQFIKLTGKEIWEKEKSFAIQIFRKNPKLMEANLTSTLEAIMNVANIGLSLNPASKLAYLVPRFSRNGIDICLEPSYIGLVKLITDTGSAKNVYCYPVYKGDEFQETLGTNIEIKHIPQRKSKELELVYAVAVLLDGSKHVEVMTAEEINLIRERSESYKAFVSGKIHSCVWKDDYIEMCRKTVIRKLCKYLPKTKMWDKLNDAISLDERDYKINEWQEDLIERLLNTSAISNEKKELINSYFRNYSFIEAENCIKELKDNQVDPINSGLKYNQTDINNKLKQIK